MKIIEKPYALDELRFLSEGGTRRVSAVVGFAWHDLIGREREAFEEELARLVTGSRYGLGDLGIKLVGCRGEEILLEVSGDVSLLIGDYELVMAEETREL